MAGNERDFPIISFHLSIILCYSLSFTTNIIRSYTKCNILKTIGFLLVFINLTFCIYYEKNIHKLGTLNFDCGYTKE